jgi:membrane protease YdiL (CAAX protease family)
MGLESAHSAPRSANDPMAAALRGFGLLGLLALVIIFAGNLLFIPLSALLVLAWARLSATPLTELGFSPPSSWFMTIVTGAMTGIITKLAMKAIVMPLFGAPPINYTYRYITGNAAALPWVLYAAIVGAGFGEEVLFRGYLFERLGRLMGPGPQTTVACVLITTFLFAVAHFPEQGLPGVQQAAVMGLVFGTLYGITKRLWLPMVTHIAFDLTAVAIIYWGLESAIARSMLG